MAWHIVEKLIEQTGEHSTLIGKFWVTSFFIIRLLIVAAISENVWDDSQSEFVCNTLSPGCSNVCFNEYSPIALTRYWYLQLLCTALPSIIFIVYTAHKLSVVSEIVKSRKAENKAIKEAEHEKKKELRGAEDESSTDGDDESEEEDNEEEGEMVAAKLSEDAPSKLFLAYFFMVFLRLLVEIGFIIGQYYVYTFKFMMPELFQCQHWPCPNVVDCFVLRPKEKSVLICLFYVTGVVMVILNVMELFHLAPNFAKAWKERGDDITALKPEGPSFGRGNMNEWAPGTEYYEEDIDGYPNAVGLPTLFPIDQGMNNRRRRRRRNRRGRR